MKPALLDVNMLLALAWPTHQHHDAAHDWFRDEATFGWRTCALTQLAFVRLSSNPAYTADAVTPRDAGHLLVRLIAHQSHAFWNELGPVDEDLLMRATGHRQVMDAYLVKVARDHQGRVVTFDVRLAAHALDAGEVDTIGAITQDP